MARELSYDENLLYDIEFEAALFGEGVVQCLAAEVHTSSQDLKVGA